MESRISFLKLQGIFPLHCNTLALKDGKIGEKKKEEENHSYRCSIIQPFKLLQAFPLCVSSGALKTTFYLKIIVDSQEVEKIEQRGPCPLQPVSPNDNVLHECRIIASPGDWHWHSPQTFRNHQFYLLRHFVNIIIIGFYVWSIFYFFLINLLSYGF